MKTRCESNPNRKYAANPEHAQHASMPQRFYLRFLNTNGALRSEVPEFAAYFRRALSEVRGSQDPGTRPGFTLPQHAVLLEKIGLCSEVFDFPRTSELRGPAKRVLATLAASATTSSCRGNAKGPLSANQTTTLLCLRLT